MKTQDVRRDIQEIESLNKQAQIWRIGTVAASMLIVVGSLTMMRDSVNGLLQPGTTQDEFTTELSARLQKNVVPSMQTLATQTIVEMRPQIEAEVTKLNTRVPDVSAAFMKEVDTLQTNVPQTGEKVLQDTMGKMLASKESNIKTMFPDANDEKIKTLVQNVNDEAGERIMNSSDKLFSKPLQSLTNIAGSLQTIQDTEKVPAQAHSADWEMISALVSLTNSDIQKASNASKSSAAPAKMMAKPKAAAPKAVAPKAVAPKAAAPKAKEAPHAPQGY